ncbi:MAG: hypothetical protein QXE05_04170 [Nitrososphaeria archaeon]
MKYKLRLSKKIYNPKAKGFREAYILTKVIDEEQAKLILDVLQAGKVAHEHHDILGKKEPVSQGTSKGDNL